MMTGDLEAGRPALAQISRILLAFAALGGSLQAANAATTCSNFAPLVVTVVSGNPCIYFTNIANPSNFEDHISTNNVIQFENNAPISDQFGIGDVEPNAKTNPPPVDVTTVTASQGNVQKTLIFNPQPTIPNQFAGSIGNVNHTGPWTLTIANGTNVATATDVATTVTGDLSGAVTLPFVTATTLSAGLTPTFTWTVPAGTPATVAHVTIFDHGQITVAGYDARILDATVPIGTDSYTVLSKDFGANQGPTLKDGDNYTVSIQLEQLRSDGSLLSRSQSFVNFSPLPAGSPPALMPMVSQVGGHTVWQFDAPVVQGQPIYIDPLVSTGYIYQIGAGDPNFASVTLPDIGNPNPYSLYVWDGTSFVFETTLAAGTTFDFGSNGIGEFEVLGIDPNLGLDPANVAAFITKLTFTGSGTFDGTMTPVTTDVPEPASWMLLAGGLIGCGLFRRRPRDGHDRASSRQHRRSA